MKNLKASSSKLKIPKKNLHINTSKESFPIPKDKIEILREMRREKLCFSFKFFDREIDEFNLGNVCHSWYIILLDILKTVCDLNINELIQQRQHYDCHGHDWTKLKFKYKLDDGFLDQVECLQFRLSKSKGRVNGFVIGNIFYIVWLDPHHNLYPDDRYGGVKCYDKPLTCYEILENYNFDLLEKIHELEQENNTLLELLDNQTKLSDS